MFSNSANVERHGQYLGEKKYFKNRGYPHFHVTITSSKLLNFYVHRARRDIYYRSEHVSQCTAVPL